MSFYNLSENLILIFFSLGMNYEKTEKEKQLKTQVKLTASSATLYDLSEETQHGVQQIMALCLHKIFPVLTALQAWWHQWSLKASRMNWLLVSAKKCEHFSPGNHIYHTEHHNHLLQWWTLNYMKRISTHSYSNCDTWSYVSKPS